jgi:hypothetical protein
MGDRAFSDPDRQLIVTYLRDGPLVGPDSTLIRLYQRLKALDVGHFIRPERIPLDLVADMGVLGRTHVVDCSQEDPGNFQFVLYGREALIENRRNFEGQRIRDAHSPTIRDFGAYEYNRIKTKASVDFACVSCISDESTYHYRRMVLPLSQTGQHVSHLLVSTVIDTQAA